MGDGLIRVSQPRINGLPEWMEKDWTLLHLKVLMPWALGFFKYSSIKEHLTSIVGLEGNTSYNRQSLQLKNNGFWVWGGLAIANPSKISLSQLWTMSTFHRKSVKL
jgi:hypothetical protein